MASAMPSTTTTTTLRPLFISQQRPTRFFFVTSGIKFPDKKWIDNKNKNNYYHHKNVSAYPGFPVLTSCSSYSLHSFLSLCSRSLLSHPSLCFLFQSRSPPLRSPFSYMTTTNQSSPDPPPQSPSTKTVRVVVKGRVQGVFYRNWTVENATQLGLKGWVRNRRDGSVEALFSGDSDKVQEMEQRCRRGPHDALVTGFLVFPSSDDPGIGFQRKATV
ncbi:hypothetical protein Peur_071166 [Populus x canadensis]|uniref:acylphosphatase n=1 Tax=Populus deltoides TaxID=3696 RepID=A0A8T2WWL8_POPDE|nr:hypothetical protein H0E87_026796 [Populus deltoides]